MKSYYLYLSIILLLLFSCGEKKTGFVQVSKLYNDFEMTKELNKKIEENVLIKNQLLDSLKFGIKQLELQLNAGQTAELIKAYQLKKQEYQYKENLFTEENQRLMQTYNEQALNQINTYVEEYGKQNKYEYIYGASGNGSLMYADDQKDLTEEILAYINHKYQGK